jgi:tRNA threonylcarbamoyladenosine biosynthesis protein TsaE
MARRRQLRREIVSRSAAETEREGERLARHLCRGDVVALVGALGTGKTCFTRGLARGLGVEDTSQVCSPSFVLLNVYRGRLPLYHFDAHRLGGGLEFLDTGISDCADGVLVVEWADRAVVPLEHASWVVRFYHRSKNTRRIVLIRRS